MQDAAQDVLAWDQSLQDAIHSRRGEDVGEWVEQRVADTLQSGAEGALRNLAEVLARNIALAERVRESIRREIFDLGRQRRCVGAGTVVESRPSHSFVA